MPRLCCFTAAGFIPNIRYRAWICVAGQPCGRENSASVILDFGEGGLGFSQLLLQF